MTSTDDASFAGTPFGQVTTVPDAPRDPVTLAGSSAADQCRITVNGPDGRADLAVPTAATIGLLVPVLAKHVSRQQEQDQAWVLQRLGEPPLDFDATPELADLHDGDVLYLRAADDAMPELVYDDLADGVAESIAARGDRWQPDSTRRILIGLSTLAVVALGAATVFAGGPGGLLALYCGLITLVMGGAAVAVHYADGGRQLSLVVGVGACAFAAVGGLIGQQAVADVFSPQSSGVLLSGVCVALVALAIGLATRGGIAVYGTAVLLGVSAIAGSLLLTGTSADIVGATSTVAVALFLFGTFGPRVATRLARLRVAHLPRTTEELQQDIDPTPASVVTARSANADGYLTAVIVAGTIVFLVGTMVVARTDSWIAWVLPLTFSVALLLRARSLESVWQRGATVWGGALGITVVVLGYAFSLSPTGRIGVLVGMLLVVAALLVGAWRLPTTRLLPIWGHVADIVELWIALALLPLLLVVLDAYTFFRALAG